MPHYSVLRIVMDMINQNNFARGVESSSFLRASATPRDAEFVIRNL